VSIFDKNDLFGYSLKRETLQSSTEFQMRRAPYLFILVMFGFYLFHTFLEWDVSIVKDSALRTAISVHALFQMFPFAVGAICYLLLDIRDNMRK